jgi:glycosyltransferase involved in cell wall biosynthesis
MKISIVIPAYNEEQSIEYVTAELLAYLDGKDGEIILVNDGSQDRTGAVIDSMSAKHPGRIRCIHHLTNVGYAATLRDGFSAAMHEWTFYMDGDGQYDPQEIDMLQRLANDADFIVGYRRERRDSWLRVFAARVFNMIARTLFDIPVRDIDCSFKLMRSDRLSQIKISSSGFLIDTELLAKARQRGFTIREIAITHRPRQYGKSSIRPIHVVETFLGFLWLKRELRRTRSMAE